ncbi:MAG: cobaltochelatase subunit CobN, partial [Gammaproteobacteria bacterium]|nr:cobaltochelatase subunit CobN [Gammaproteobacteria bacterium]
EQVFIIPRMELGNLIVLPQGGRSNSAKDHANRYHDMKTPVNHGYLAIYLYARARFNADAFIHLGTHGSQEWLLGKERGLSVNDSPNLAIGNVPTFYPYIIDNVGEAMQAKRRGRATMISHLTPGFAKAGLYSDIAKLNELITNYLILDQGQTQTNTQTSIETLVEDLNLLQDLALTKQQFHQDFANNLATLQDQLNEMAQQAQPLGVHTFGLLPKEQHLYTTMLQMLGDDFTQAAKLYEDQQGLTLPESERVDRLNVTKLTALAGFQLLQASISGQSLPDLPATLAAHLVTAQLYWDNFADIAEIKHLLAAMSANFIPVGYGGDPIRNPQAVPTGRNLIGFNPAKVPSKEAYQAGVTLMEQTIADYRAKHGRYPQKLAYSLWSLETMRHHGALESQVLYALGVKPKWNDQDQVIGVDVIPMSELKRPRIDVVLSATGLYRDAFPNVMLWMAEAIDTIAQMKEDNNFVYRHSQALKQQLLDQGKSTEDAEYLSTVRIFSNDSGSYGTGLASQTLDSGSWETDDAMSEVYLKRMGYAYGKDEKRWSDKVNDIDLYGKVLSGTDAVIFSRSTNLYALLTNDDPFQYFGGIGQAVRKLDGKTPEMYVSNLRRKDNVKAQTMSSFLNNEMRGRYFHPRWIKAMQDSGYAGATAILDRMNNMWGWEVMTPELVRDDQWQEFFAVYIEDKYQLDIKQFFEQNNAHALAQILERMLEANRKDYWQTDPATVKKMLETYIDLANRYDVVTDNDKFNDFVAAQAAGFGLAPLMPALAVPPAAQTAKTPATEQVKGQQLQQVNQDHSTDNDYWYLLPWFSLFAIFLFGMGQPMITRAPQPA